MAHIHLPEGSFSITWVIIWTAVALLIIGGCLFWLRKVRKVDNRMITLSGLLTAAMFTAFLIDIPVPIPLVGEVHLSLTPLIGIIAGPAMGGIIALIVNIFGAAVGHGGWGLIGANLIVNMTEVLTAYFCFQWISRAVKLKVLYTAGVSAFVALFMGNLAMIAIILISGVQGEEVAPASLLALAAVNLAMAVIEAIITGYIVAYIQKVRPDMLR